MERYVDGGEVWMLGSRSFGWGRKGNGFEGMKVTVMAMD